MTDLESFMIFEDCLNNFWVIKSREYCWKKVGQNEWFFFFYGLFSAQGQVVNLTLYECCVTLK